MCREEDAMKESLGMILHPSSSCEGAVHAEPESQSLVSDCFSSNMTLESANHRCHYQSPRWPQETLLQWLSVTHVFTMYFIDVTSRQELETAALLRCGCPHQTSCQMKKPTPNLDNHSVITVWAHSSISFREGSAVGCNVAEIAQLPRCPLFKTLSSVSGSCAFCAKGFSGMLSASMSYSGGGVGGD